MSFGQLRAEYAIVCSCTASPRTIYKGDHQKKSVTVPSLASIMPPSSTSLRKDLSMLLIGLLLLCHITTVSARPHSTYTDNYKLSTSDLTNLSDNDILECLMNPQCNIKTVLEATTRQPDFASRVKGRELSDILAALTEEEPTVALERPSEEQYMTGNVREESPTRNILSSLKRYGGSVHHGRLNKVSFNKRVADDRGDKGFLQEW